MIIQTITLVVVIVKNDLCSANDKLYLFTVKLCFFYEHFYSAAALLVMQSAVLATAIPPVPPCVRPTHAGIVLRGIKMGSCGLHFKVAKTL